MDRETVTPLPTGYIPLLPLDPCEQIAPLRDVPDDWQVWTGEDWVWVASLRGHAWSDSVWATVRPADDVYVHPRHGASEDGPVLD